MRRRGRTYRDSALRGQLAWLIGLRWLAGVVVIAGALGDWLVFGRYRLSGWMAAQGAVILLYNAVIWWALPRVATRRRPLLALSLAQILLDLTCLTHLTMWTGGLLSPLVGFFVFHMVFASLLMPRSMAYASALAGIGLVAGGLRLTGQWPASLESWLMLWGWTLTLLFTVFLANHIVRRLRRQRRRLERLTRQMEKHQRQLVQHEKMVAMGQMAAGVAHEVSNPLASMDSLLQLMQRNPDRPRPEAIATLREQVSRVQATVRLMRTFAHRGDAGGALAPAELEVDAVIDEALEMLRLDPRWGGVRLERVRFAGCRCAVDGAALRQVLVNLIINALDAVEGLPSALITVRAGCGEGECTVEVSDNGPGVAPTARRHLFEPFFTTKSVGKGTGLGLAISRSLMEQQGARITLRTGRGAGATFCVQLPKVSRSQE